MSRAGVAPLSSNWKKLQAALDSEKQTKKEKKAVGGGGSGTKRKREEPNTRNTTRNGVKKAKLCAAHVTRGEKQRTMGGYLSTPASAAEAPSRASAPIHDHDSAPAGKRTHEDDINGGEDDINAGLHPTRRIGRYVALDCEMVGTGPPPHSDSVLARASLVNFHGEQIYDSYVRPPPGVHVQDYRTFVSGIKPHHLRPGYARPFKQVQEDVAAILQGRVLVGHALRNDLNALMLGHPKRDLRDTSRHPKFRIDSKGKPPALRHLARSELGIEIQTGEHSSVEDARSAMLLFQKEKKGFEEENRRHFGTRRVADGTRKGRASNEEPPAVDAQEEDAQDEDEELDLLEGEAESEVLDQMARGGQSGHAKAKKRRQKKRTKRK